MGLRLSIVSFDTLVTILIRHSGGIGCEYNAFNGQFVPGSYEQIPYANGNYSTTTYNFAVTATVRSAQDPFISAQDITKGSMNFGKTKSQAEKTPLIIMIVGICLLVPCLVFTGFCVYWIKKQSKEETTENTTLIPQ